MPSEVIDTNVLVVATAEITGWQRPRIPTDDPLVRRRVFDWVRTFRNDVARQLVLDRGRTILAEYRNNLPDHGHFGREVIQHKWDTNGIHFVELTYWANGSELVADLPPEVDKYFHDLGDRKMVAAAFNASAPLVNCTDGDWAEAGPAEGLRILGIRVVQLLTEAEIAACQSATT